MNFYPIGSIVKLKELERYVMITGWFQTDESEQKWDYCGCMFPEGMTSPDSAVMFNNEGIENIYFIGYQDRIQMEYKEQFLDYAEKNFPNWDNDKLESYKQHSEIK